MINIVVDDAYADDDDVDDGDDGDDHDDDEYDVDDDDDDEATALCYSGSLLQLMVCHFKAMDGLSESCITCINGGWCQGKPYHWVTICEEISNQCLLAHVPSSQRTDKLLQHS